jgi:hypothetical protein
MEFGAFPLGLEICIDLEMDLISDNSAGSCTEVTMLGS